MFERFSRARSEAILLSLLVASFAACSDGSGGSGGIDCDPGEFPMAGVCTICPVGSYCPDGRRRTECPVGRFNVVPGADDVGDCEPCAPGTFAATTGQSTCIDCAVGEFLAVSGASACEDCPVGTFGNAPGATECVACAPGSFNATPGSSTCFDCAPGRFQDQAGSSVCLECSLGTYQSAPGSSACVFCSPGTFGNVQGAVACTNCEPDTFQSNAGSSACFDCSCDDSNPATIDSCDPVDGTCTNATPISVQGAPAPVPSISRWGMAIYALGLLVAGLNALRPRRA